MVRRGWLEHGPGPRQRDFTDDLVAVGWDEVLDRVAREITRVKTQAGPTAIYGGSYGWASAGRFHHASGQI
ncbi:molybdopterin-dependent oxidoreductase, partial [Acinetobacter baumannii]